MELVEILKDREIPDPLENFARELWSVYRHGAAHPLLTRATAEIGLMLVNRHPEWKVPSSVYSVVIPIVQKDARYEQLKARIPAEGFETEELKNLLVFFFGPEKARCAAHAWQRLRFRMYQTDSVRRSFRAPANRELYFRQQLDFLIGAIPQFYLWTGYNEKKRFYDLTLAEQMRYGHHPHFGEMFRLWAAALDLGDGEVFRRAEDIVFNRDDGGKISQMLIHALLSSEKPEAWQLVEKLLLAAQRQEGLRQTVLECLDETSRGALEYMIGMILDNSLARFSSVVRAVDVWAGLGWESERERTVNSFLEKAREYLAGPEKIPEAVESANNLDVYMALWARGVDDVERCAPLLDWLLENGDAEKRALALKFALETQHEALSLPLFYRALDDAEPLVLAWALRGIETLTYRDADRYRSDPRCPELFDRLHRIVERAGAKEKSFTGKIFSWTEIAFKRNSALALMVELIGRSRRRLEVVLEYFDAMDVYLRQRVTRHILPDYTAYSWEKEKERKPLTAFERDFAFGLLSDRGEYMVRAAFNALRDETFSDAELDVLQNLLKRRGADFRGRIIKLLLGQPDEKLAPAAARLLEKGDGEQRLAGLDILLQAKKAERLETDGARLVAAFKTRRQISPKEEILLAQLVEADAAAVDYSAANGYGLYDPSKSVSPLVAPRIDPENVYEKRNARHAYGFSVPFEKVRAELERLERLYSENRHYEYEVENYWGPVQTVLLGNTFRSKRKEHTKFATPRERFESYPLFEVWEKWFLDSGLDAGDLEIVQLSTKPKPLSKHLIPAYEELMPRSVVKMYSYNNPVCLITAALQTVYPFAEKNEFMLGGSARLFAGLTPEQLLFKPKDSYYNYYGDGWQNETVHHAFYHLIDVNSLDARHLEQLWNLAHWRQYSGRPENIPHSFPTLIVFARAYEQGLIGTDEFLRGLVRGDNLQLLSAKKPREYDFDYFERFDFLRPLFERVREHLLDIELKRGDTATPVTGLVGNLQAIYGARRFTEILAGLGKTPLNRGYYYYARGDEINKQRSFSRLLKNCYPLDTDTPAEFDRLVKAARITEKQLVEAAVYAPQWKRFVSENLRWNGLDSAVWWMHAHTRNASYREESAEAESEIAKCSAVDLQDFKDGAVDRDWFLAAYRQLGQKRWEIVYDAAKYISDGSGHRRARLYADVILGRTKIREIAQKVKTKRDQDCLRVYGLVPLSRSNPEKDVLGRYEYIQQFKKESRQFGAQKQSSEALAIRVAMENLARNAGYSDPVRLTWAMETRQVRRIFAAETEITAGGATVRLVIDDEGKAEIVVAKGGKMLKSIPPALRKDKRVIELGEYKKTLKEQFRRSRRGLEEAMVRGDEFEPPELETLFAHPVISKHLEKLVFTAGDAHGFYRDGRLVSAKGAEFALDGKAKPRIAHCVDLYRTGEWSDYQHYCFEHEIRQPFKQIFRELYTPTADELREKSVSRRYAGHQIQPKQTLALLKTRGWKVDYEEGLQKVFHREGFTAKMYAMADWFSPAEVESPTLETVVFESLKDFRSVDFEAIGPRIFSEVMRDVDLVVSVAHAGGVDPEASQSSIEMRTVLLQETLRLFRLDNVAVEGSHARIKGTMGEYSVHLGSAVVHKMPGGYLSILPVHSQHRGRIFLPFADDDPKSAELISKVLLLARDAEIQDPTILRQLV
ncbi:MAG: DUF4132 domain-containing protein [Acidobacteria bacterium]|nr:DUF4132 domain-containing protein [Acidobacteriota bacterium]